MQPCGAVVVAALLPDADAVFGWAAWEVVKLWQLHRRTRITALSRMTDDASCPKIDLLPAFSSAWSRDNQCLLFSRNELMVSIKIELAAPAGPR